MLDIFCHCLPPRYLQAAARRIERSSFMFERAQTIGPMVNLDARLRLLERFPGYRQVLSLASPTIETLVAPTHAPELARAANDAMAEWVAQAPDRHESFIATIPLNRPAEAVKETERAIRELGAVGVQVYTNVNGRPIDAPEILDVFAATAELGGAVWLHPIRPMNVPDYAGEAYSKFDLWWAFAWPHETSVAMGRLVFAGVFDRWPNLPIITHHAGGTVPMMEGRLRLGLARLGTRNPPELADAARTPLAEPPLDAFRRFHADTATFGSRAALQCGLDFFGKDRLLFGTDMPFDPEHGAACIRETLRAIDELGLSPTDKHALLEGSARRVLRLTSA